MNDNIIDIFDKEIISNPSNYYDNKHLNFHPHSQVIWREYNIRLINNSDQIQTLSCNVLFYSLPPEPRGLIEGIKCELLGVEDELLR